MKEDGLGLATLETGVSQERKCITLCCLVLSCTTAQHKSGITSEGKYALPCRHYPVLSSTAEEWWRYSWRKRQPVSSNEASDKTV